MLKISDECTVEKLEKGLEQHFDPTQTLMIDLQDVTVFESSALISFVSFLGQHTNEEKVMPVILDLPESKDARDYLRQFHFSEMLYQNTNKPFSQFCSTRSFLRYFGENSSTKTMCYSNLADLLMRSDYFCFSDLNSDNPDNSVDFLRDKWRKPHGFLKSNLGLNAQEMDLIPNRIVIESSLSAVHRPEADKMIANTSIVQEGDKKYLELLFWDNGKALEKDFIKQTLTDREKIFSVKNSSSDELNLLIPVDAAVFLLSGSVSFQAEGYLLTAKKDDQFGQKYSMNVTERKASPFALTGNLVTYKLPLRQ